MHGIGNAGRNERRLMVEYSDLGYFALGAVAGVSFGVMLAGWSIKRIILKEQRIPKFLQEIGVRMPNRVIKAK